MLERTPPVHVLFLAANAVVLTLFAYTLIVVAIADQPSPDEAVIFLGLSDPQATEYAAWPYFIKIVPFLIYQCLGINTAMGFQLLGALLAAAGAMGVNYLVLTRFKLPDETRLLCVAGFDLLLITSTSLHNYAVFAVTAYPLRILSGLVFIHILIAYSPGNPKPGMTHTLVLGSILAVFSFVHPILVLPMFAAYASLIAAHAINKHALRGHLAEWMLRFLLLVALPAIPGALVVLLAPHADMADPRDAIRDLYFFLNDSYKKDPAGFLAFTLNNMKALLLSACLPYSLTTRLASSMLGWIPLGLFATGMIVSFRHRGNIRFALALFVLVDLALRLGANWAGAFPFGGDLRYALSQAFSLALLVSLGAADIVNECLGRVSTYLSRGAQAPPGPRWSYAWSGLVLAAGTIAGVLLSVAKTEATASLLQEKREARNSYGALNNSTIILDSGMYVVTHYHFGAPFFDRNQCIVIPKMFIPRDISSEALNDLTNTISRADRILIITGMEFNAAHFREAFSAVDARFHRVSQRVLLKSSFSEWELRPENPH